MHPGLYRDNVVLTIALSASLALEAAARKKRIREGYLQTPTLVFLHNFQHKLVGGGGISGVEGGTKE